MGRMDISFAKKGGQGENSVSGQVFYDVEKDGCLGFESYPLGSGITVNLFSVVPGSQPLTVLTGTNGTYFFDNVPDGSYYVTVEPPLGNEVTLFPVSPLFPVCNEIDPSTGRSKEFPLSQGMNIELNIGVTDTIDR